MLCAAVRPAACRVTDPELVWSLCSTRPKGPEEQFSLFGEVFPDTLRVSLCQDEEGGGRRAARQRPASPVPMEMEQLFDMDVLMSEFSDTLFSTLASHQPVACPSERHTGELSQSPAVPGPCSFVIGFI